MKCLSLISGALIFSLTACTSKVKHLQSSSFSKPQKSNEELVVISPPNIPFSRDDAFYPLRRDPLDGKIYPSYQHRECVKTFIVCLKYEVRTVFFKDLTWFEMNSFGLKKRRDIK